MPATKIDRDKLRAAIRTMGDDWSYYLLDDAVDLLSQAKLAKLIEGYFPPDKLRPDTEPLSLIDKVRHFRDASLTGRYYENFDVNSKNYTQTSRETRAWCSECCRLFDHLIAHSKKNKNAQTVAAFDTLFDLLKHIDECLDDVIFFADEGGSWQVPVNWNKVFPAYFKCIAPVTAPTEYAERVVQLVDRYQKWDSKKYLAAAKRVADSHQKEAFKKA